MGRDVEGLSIGYTGYVIVLFFLTGALILITDVKAYKNAELKKEQKVAMFLGWINVSMGFMLMVGNWVYKYFVW